MAPQRYEAVNSHDDDDHVENVPAVSSNGNNYSRAAVPSSPPPSFRSRASSVDNSRHQRHERDPLVSDADRTLADTFDSPSDSEDEEEFRSADNGSPHRRPRLDDRQRVLSGRPDSPGAQAGEAESVNNITSVNNRPQVERTVTQLPAFPPASSTQRRNGSSMAHDGVFANMSAKPERGGDSEDEKPPSYEQAAADATPPYWETTILAPGGSSNPDDVFIDGLPVGSFFSFVWNGMISMSFQLVGFLLTYLLHTTHAAKNGSKAGLGVTLVQYGFGMKGVSSGGGPTEDGQQDQGNFIPPPADPNSHDFDPNAASKFVADAAAAASQGSQGSHGMSAMKASDWFAYAIMIVGWFILIKSVSEYLKARRHEQLVLQSPSRGLGVAVVSEEERPEGAV